MRAGLGDGRRHGLQIARVEAMDAVHLVDGTGERTASRRITSSRRWRACRGSARRRGFGEAEQARERHADQQLAADVGQAEHDCVAPVRQRMDRAQLGDFVDDRSAARATPTDAEDRPNGSPRLLPAAPPAKCAGPVGDIAGRRSADRAATAPPRRRPGSCGSGRAASARDTIRRRGRRSGSSNRRSPCAASAIRGQVLPLPGPPFGDAALRWFSPFAPASSPCFFQQEREMGERRS